MNKLLALAALFAALLLAGTTPAEAKMSVIGFASAKHSRVCVVSAKKTMDCPGANKATAPKYSSHFGIPFDKWNSAKTGQLYRCDVTNFKFALHYPIISSTKVKACRAA
jgi:hypothetical protein